jgi:hypothetical protein
MALVHHGLAAPEPLLESYSLERSAVGRQVLTDAGRLTTLALVKSGVLQSIRNHVAALVFGLSSVREIMADKLRELSIGYPHSPLTVPAHHSHGGPTPGQRAPLSDTHHPVGAGSNPRFALFAPPTSEIAALIARHPAILEPDPRPVLSEENLCLVRPDGYIAIVTTPNEWPEMEKYLHELTGSP